MGQYIGAAKFRFVLLISYFMLFAAYVMQVQLFGWVLFVHIIREIQF